MNAVVQAVAPSSIKQNQALIVGRIEGMREWDGADSSGYVTKVRLPAPDEYSSAALVEVSTKRKLGKEGEEIKVLCSVSGWLKRGVSLVTKEPYEIVNMRLTAVE